MSYTPTSWNTGDTITAAKLNKLEQGVADAGGVLRVTENNNHTLDKTWQEIYNATFSILFTADGTQCLQVYCGEDEGDYLVAYWTVDLARQKVYVADSASGYPVLSDQESQ